MLINQFKEIVSKYAHNVALKYYNKQLTYRQVDQQTDQMAENLISVLTDNQNCDHSNSLIGVNLSPGINYILSILAIHKAGCSYVPLDIKSSSDEINYILDDCRPACIIVDSDVTHTILSMNTRIIYVNDLHKTSLNKSIKTLNQPELAYIIYTSGTTGKPKGVMINKISIIELVVNTDYITINPHDCVAQISSLSFDAATFEIWGALLNGACLVIENIAHLLEASKFKEFILKNKIDIVYLTTSLFNYLYTQDKSVYTNINVLITGGEEANVAIFNDIILNDQRPKRIIHAYGPTENTTYSLVFPLPDNMTYEDTIPIGKPIMGTYCYVLDEKLNPVKPGEVGELFLAGNGLAQKYLNQEKLTDKKFIQVSINGTLINVYKTGDRVRINDQGFYEFCGRIDDQIKLYGHRIELSGIINIIQEYPKIRNAVILLTQGKNNKYLSAYIQLKKGSFQLSLDELVNFLKQKLPIYMLPAEYILVTEFPLNKNGKIDKAKLVDLQKNYLINDQVNNLTPNENNLFNEVIKILSEVANIPAIIISAKNNFCNLGLNSISLMEFIVRLQVSLKLDLQLADLYRFENIEKFIKTISKSDYKIKHRYTAIEAAHFSSSINFSLSYSQQQMISHIRLSDNANIYNESIVIDMKHTVKQSQLNSAINQFRERHPMTRVRIIYNDNHNYYEQLIMPYSPVELEIIDFTDDKNPCKKFLSDAKNKASKTFDIFKDELIKFYLFKLSNDVYKLLVIAHHVLIDAHAIFKILKNELYISYHQMSLPAVSQYQYFDYVLWEIEQSEKWLNSISKIYWQSQIDNLPITSFIDGTVSSSNHRGKRINFKIEKSTVISLQQYANKNNVTLFSLALSVFYILIFKFSDALDMVVGSVVSIRERSEWQNIFGCFLNTILIRYQLNEDIDFNNHVKQVDIKLKELRNHQNYPFKKIIELASDAHIHTQLFNIAFIFEVGQDCSFENDWQVNQLDVHNQTCKFDCIFEIDNYNDEYFGRVEFNTSIYTNSMINTLIESYIYLLETIVTQEYKSIRYIEFIPHSKRAASIAYGDRIYRTESKLLDYFYEALDVAPQSVCVQCTSYRWTYYEVNQLAEQLADILFSKNVNCDAIIAILLERNSLYLVAIIAILKLNATCLPLEMNLPNERLCSMLNQAGADYIIIDKITKKFNRASTESILIEYPFPDSNNKRKVNTNDLLSHVPYIIFTSGTTGKPKGMELTDAGVINSVIGFKKEIDTATIDTIMNVSSFTFDAAILDCWLSILSRSTLFILEQRQRLEPKLVNTILSNAKSSLLLATPTLLKIYLDNDVDFKNSTIVSVGENLSSTLAKLLLRKSNVLFNGYGPAEMTIGCLIKKIISSKHVTVGKPIANVTAMIVNKNYQILPRGFRGELILAGVGNVTKYINCISQSDEKFINANTVKLDTSIKLNDEKIYRTGDIMQLMDNNEFMYCGRIDRQIKQHGIRIELSEIEKNIINFRINGQSIISHVFVTFEKYADHNKLIAYIRINNDLFNYRDLIIYLQHRLLSAMIPEKFYQISDIPLSNNGKIDYSILKKNAKTIMEIRSEKFSTTSEIKLAEIWKQLLPVKVVQLDDHFFCLGGNSLLAIKLVALAKKQKLNIEINTIYKHPILSDMALYVQNNMHNKDRFSNIIFPVKTCDHAKINILLFSDITGFATPYEALSEVGSDFDVNVVAFHSPLNHGFFSDSLTQYLGVYLSIIETLELNGIIILAGWSYGGIIASALLEEMQDRYEISGLILIDSYFDIADQKGIRATQKNILKKIDLPNTNQETIKKISETIYSHLSMIATYVPAQHTIPTLYFECMTPFTARPAPGFRQWRNILKQYKHVCINCNHYQVLQSPYNMQLKHYIDDFITIASKGTTQNSIKSEIEV